jgi:predicted CopG family antitoxin
MRKTLMISKELYDELEMIRKLTGLRTYTATIKHMIELKKKELNITEW